jgi:protein-L-isoaspartate(D-aspartate) O-methyltransferase
MTSQPTGVAIGPFHGGTLDVVADRGPDALVQASRRAGVRDERLLAAIAEVPRSDFVPADHARRANVDSPVPIPHDQVTTQPSLVAQMIDALSLSGRETVLEVGTGYGWQTALLARLAADVWSIERFADLAATARANLAAHGLANAHVVVGDGTLGLAEHAPYDAIIVAAAFPDVPSPLVAQLVEGGRLVQPIGRGGREDVVLFAKREGAPATVRVLTGARFVRLVGSYGFPEEL